MKFIGDISKLEWEMIENEDPWGPSFIRIGFTNNGEFPVFFNKLSFGINIKLANKEIVSYTFPIGNEGEEVSYVCTYEELLPEIIRIIPELVGIPYDIYVWAKNNGKYFSKEFKIIIPIPDSVNPSPKEWDDTEKKYKFLVPYPQKFPKKGFFWAWNEEKNCWTEEKIPKYLLNV